MIVKFKNLYLQKLFEGAEISGKPKFERDVILKYKKTVLKLALADNIREIKLQKGLNFESLKGDLKGYYSVRVDLKYRLIFTLEKDGSIEVSEIILIHQLSNHYK
jgi:proteic killer suppression protein